MLKLQLKLNMKSLQLFFSEINVLKVMEEPEDYVVEEKLHFISKRVEVEPVKGRPTLHLPSTLVCSILYGLLCLIYHPY